jgi:hypothetical protein
VGVCTSLYVRARNVHRYSSVTVTSALAAMAARLVGSLIQDLLNLPRAVALCEVTETFHPKAYPWIPNFWFAAMWRTPRHPIFARPEEEAHPERMRRRCVCVICPMTLI